MMCLGGSTYFGPDKAAVDEVGTPVQRLTAGIRFAIPDLGSSLPPALTRPAASSTAP
jgi:hypothetical protein